MKSKSLVDRVNKEDSGHANKIPEDQKLSTGSDQGDDKSTGNTGSEPQTDEACPTNSCEIKNLKAFAAEEEGVYFSRFDHEAEAEGYDPDDDEYGI